MIAEELMKLFSRVGLPKEILTDQGSNLLPSCWQSSIGCYRFGVFVPLRIILKQMDTLKVQPNTESYAEENGHRRRKDWDRLLPYLLFAYREVPQVSTGFSPFELLYGRAVHGPLDVIEESLEAEQKSDESVVSYVMGVQETLSPHVQYGDGKFEESSGAAEAMVR